MNHTQIHNALRDRCLVALSQARLGVFWGNETGVGFRDGAPLRYGCLGSSDIIGCAIGGIFTGIEIKTGKAKQSDKQKTWGARIEYHGGIYIVGRSVEQVLHDLRLRLQCKS